MQKLKFFLLFFTLVFLLSALCSAPIHAQEANEQTPWVAPPEADKLVNPLKDQEAALKLGKKIYTSECVVCHGTYGNAETNIAETMEQKPKNFTKEDFMQQSDGAIFWKLSEGRGLMQPFKTMLTEEEIWSVVVYVKELAQKEE
jgi:mono/diheme cytochrome c family protein